MKKISLIALIVLLVTGQGFCLQLIIPSEVTQGEVFTVFLTEDILENGITVSLGRGGDIYSSTNSFSAVIDGARRTLALLGVPSTLSPGRYTVSASDGEETVETEFLVIKKEFIEENIVLGKSMSSLRKSDDIRKAEQWRNLYAILKTVNTADVFEDDGLILPVESLRKTSFFGDRRTFKYNDGTSAQSIHNGIDYSAETGTPVYAAGDGKVLLSVERILSGLTVVIEHLPGVYSLYFHLDSIETGEGLMVKAGDLIGTVGSTGLVTGAHLHWEVRVAGVAVDPEALVGSFIIDKDFILSNIE
ncbi:MAG: M23 family metallopeptidase [Spirochaetales bacterium]|nr:M23 family metallopeptidase [Spirochaetales bacterium]